MLEQAACKYSIVLNVGMVMETVGIAMSALRYTVVANSR